MFNYYNIYYFFTFLIIFYKLISYLKNKNKKLKEYTKSEKVSVLFLGSTKDDALSLLPVINRLDTEKISYFISTTNEESLLLLKMSLINSLNLELIENNTFLEMIYSLFRFRPKIIITTASNGFQIIILLAKIIKCKIIIIDNGRNILKKNKLMNFVGDQLYYQSKIKYNKSKCKKIGNLKILNSSRYVSNNKNNFDNILLFTKDLKKFNYYCEMFVNLKENKKNTRLFCIIPIDFKYNMINIMKYNKINYYIWNNEPIDLNIILLDYDLILSFDNSVLKYFSSKTKITILNTCLDKECTYTLSEIAINKNCILYDWHCNKNVVVNNLIENKIILKIDNIENKYEYIINLIENNKLQTEFINNSYNWIIDLKQKTYMNIDTIVSQVHKWN
jgi:hypothetical protein